MQDRALKIMIVREVDAVAEAQKGNPDFDELSGRDALLVAKFLIQSYGYQDRIEPLQPDLLGERLVTQLLDARPDLRAGWMLDASEAEEIKKQLEEVGATVEVK